MLIIPPINFRRKRTIKPKPAGAPVLMAATYVDNGPLTLTFDQAINVAGLMGTDIVLSDGRLEDSLYNCTGTVSQPTPQSVVLELVYLKDIDSGPATLTASASNGIVSASDGSPWAGVEDLVLPFSE